MPVFLQYPLWISLLVYYRISKVEYIIIFLKSYRLKTG